MLFTDLGLSINEETTKITFGNSEINVKNYLSTKDKYDLIMITLQKSLENGIYNDFKLDMYFHLNLIYLITDLEFTDADREDEDILYDKILSSGLLDAILPAVDKSMYQYLVQTIEAMATKIERNEQSIAGVLQTFMKDMPEINGNWSELLNNMNISELGELSDIMQALGGAKFGKNTN